MLFLEKAGVAPAHCSPIMSFPSEADLLPEIASIIRDVLEQPQLALQPETKAASVRGWDSIAHVQIIMTIEEQFGLEFLVEEVTAFETLRQLAQLVARKKLTVA